MTEVRPGDWVLSFADAKIKAIGVASGIAEPAAKPDFGSVGNQWDNEGWLVPVNFKRVINPVRPKDFIGEILPYLSPKYAPIQANGNGNQGTYLAEISQDFFNKIVEKLDQPLSDFYTGPDVAAQTSADEEQAALEGRTDIGTTYKEQLVKARRGQGVFKANVRLNEAGCRFTGVSDPTMLIASHIKPWVKCSDFEKLDGSNGLLLSPHVDRLFDRGLISLEDNGAVIVSPKLDPVTLTKWGLDGIGSVSSFNAEQSAYLKFHRDQVFKQGND